MSSPRIRRISIQNFGRIRDLDLSLVGPDDKAVQQFVLAGPNGRGKTSVLEAILFGLEQDALLRRDTAHVRWTEGFPADASVTIELESKDDESPYTLVRRSPGWLGAPGSVSNIQMATPQASIPRPPVEYFSSWRSPHLVGALQPLGKGNRPEDTEQNRLWRLKQRLIDEKSRRSFGANTRETEWLDAINRAWRTLRGNDGTSLEIQLVDPDSEDAYADLFLVENGTQRCAADHLSAGELELLSAAGWLVTSGMSDGILLIDEPELHLHPQWQSTFLPALREIAPDLQIIVSTHSDAPWNAAQPWERALLVGEDDPRSARAGRAESVQPPELH